MSDDRLRVQGLGPLRAFVDGDEIDLGPPKQRAAFAVLALCGGTTVSGADLVDRIWGASAPATAAGSLHTYISGLRRALGSVQDRLTSDRNGYCLRLDRAMFDVTCAEDLAGRMRDGRDAYEQMSAHWTMPFAGVPGPFAEQARTRLDGLRLQLLIEHAEVAGGSDVVGRLSAEVPAHPFDERLRGALMRALHRSGRTAEALAQYEDLRRGLAADLGISPAQSTEAVYADILAAERAKDDREKVEDEVRPAQLPHDNDAFVGRNAELLAVLKSSAGGAEPRRRIVVIVGVGGIGKTALAVHAGHMLRGGYPDGQVYLNLRGFDPSRAALTGDAALHQLLVSVGARHVPSGHEERIALWRSLLADRRLLLVLDNAKSAEQVEDLLPGGGACFVIVTSRDRLSRLAVRHAAHRISLGALTEQESLSLLASSIGAERVRAEPDAARRLTELCDRSPFALQIAAEQVVSISGARIGDLVGQLENVQHRLDALQLADDPLCSVRAVLSWSFAALAADAAQAFRLLGVFPGTTVSRHTAAALFGVDLDRADILLGQLATLCLLEQADDRFTMHDLTRVYAAELSGELDPVERHDALERVLSWYRNTLWDRAGNGMVSRGSPIEDPHSDVPPLRFNDQRDSLRWYGQEWQNIVALIRAANLGGHHGPAWHLGTLIFDYFYANGQPLEWLDALRVAMRSAEAADNRIARAILYNHCSVAYSRLGQNETAVRQLDKGLDLLVEPDDWRHRVSLLGNLASTLREAKLYDDARARAYEAIELARKEGIDYYIGSTLDVLCELNAETGRWAEAIEAGVPALEYARRGRSRLHEANLLINIGLARHGLGQQKEAEETFGEALRVSQDAGDRYHEALALFGLARARTPGGLRDEPFGEAAVRPEGVPENAVADLARRALARFEELDAEEAAEVRAFLAGLGI